MEDNFKLIECNDDDVIECNDWAYKVSKLKQALEKLGGSDGFLQTLWSGLREQKIYYLEGNYTYDNKSFKEGMDVKILNLGSKSWKKGKLKFKLSIEFYVEEELEESSEKDVIKEPESPLDDLRRMINETTS
ncbi:KGK domain protein [Cylindrospermum stagnale PCC 7417]|uniref:KGK domain protein n=1 Tax=Cylindrospermum stagnale PCC 7417 TaxID=56107 RepID=K9X1Q8_9NOST|nr:KGK domain-containing protein [Cylindrospermum stagnale]AFZ25672.1 KGK domain protein [Cylindrospermum stagnale PCC 7417]